MSSTALFVLGYVLLAGAIVYHIVTYNTVKKIFAKKAKYHFMLNNLDVGLCTYNCATKKLEDCNEMLLNMFGYGDKDTMMQSDIKKIFGARVAESIETVQDSVVMHEVLTSNRSKEMFWASVSLKRVHFSGHDFVYLSAKNINTKKSSDANIDNYKQIINNVVMAQKLLVWKFSPQTQCFDVEIGNPMWNNTTFEKCCRLVSLDDVERFRKAFDDLQKGAINEVSLTVNIWDPLVSKYSHFEIMAASRKDAGDHVDLIYGTLKNNSDNFEEMMQLKEYKNKSQILLDNMNILQFDYDCLTRSIYYIDENGKSETLSLDMYKSFVHPEYNTEADNALSIVERRENKTISFEGKFKIPSSSAYCWCVTACIPFTLDDSGKVLKYIGFWRNDDDSYVAMQKYSLLKKQGEYSNSIKSQIIDKIIQGTQSCVTEIAKSTNLILDTPTLDMEQHRSLFRNTFENNIDALKKFTSYLSRLSKFEGLEYDEKSDINVGKMLSDIADSVNICSLAPTPICRFSIHPDDLMAGLNGRNIVQILWRYLQCALQLSAGKPLLLTCDLIDDRLLFSVKYEGKNLDVDRYEDNLASDNSESVSSNMSVCKLLATQMGATVGMESDNGNRSSLWLTVPFVPSVNIADEIVDAENQEATISEKPDESRPAVLVIDDTAGGTMLLNTMLSVDYDTVCCDDIVKVKELLDARKFGVAVINAEMQSIDSFALVKCIRAKSPETRLVAIKPNHYRARTDAYDAVVNKPIKPSELKKAINGNA